MVTKLKQDLLDYKRSALAKKASLPAGHAKLTDLQIVGCKLQEVAEQVSEAIH